MDDSGIILAASYKQIVVEVAELLTEKRFYEDAVAFYRTLEQIPDELSISSIITMAKCYLHDDHLLEAQSTLEEACKRDSQNIEARVELARLFERMDEVDQAFVYVNQVLELESLQKPRVYRKRAKPASVVKPKLAPKLAKLTEVGQSVERDTVDEPEDPTLAGYLQEMYKIMNVEAEGMRKGNARAMEVWMASAKALTEDFRSCAAFYPWSMKEFDGYTAAEQVEAEISLKSDLTAMAQQHAKGQLTFPTPKNTANPE